MSAAPNPTSSATPTRLSNHRSVRTLRRVVEAFIEPVKLVRAVAELPRFGRDYRRFRGAATAAGLPCPPWSDVHPVFGQRGSHEFDAHYIYLNGWAARRIITFAPEAHVDVGSQLSFTTVLGAALSVQIVEFRPVPLALSGLTFTQGSILELPFQDDSVRSLSCLHVIEHIGLGRYGDPIDPFGTRKAAAELVRVLAPGGQLLVGLPVGRPRVCFNAHRVHSEQEVLDMFSGLRLIEFSGVDDARRFTIDRNRGELDSCEYGCGFFRFTK